jgi:hypothetical protein
MSGIVPRAGLSRRTFLRSGAATLGGAVLAAPLAGLQLRQHVGDRPNPRHGYGTL